MNNPVGTGPYSLGTWEHGSQIVLNANPDYWGTAPLTPSAVFQWNNEGSQRLVSLQSGAADAIDNLGPNDYAAVEGDANLALVERSPLNVAYLGFNVDMAPFDNPLVRQAIALDGRPPAAHRQLLPAWLRGGHAVPAAGDVRLPGGLRRLHAVTSRRPSSCSPTPATPMGST